MPKTKQHTRTISLQEAQLIAFSFRRQTQTAWTRGTIQDFVRTGKTGSQLLSSVRFLALDPELSEQDTEDVQALLEYLTSRQSLVGKVGYWLRGPQ